MEITECSKFNKIDYNDLAKLQSTLTVSKAPDGTFKKLTVRFEDYNPDQQVQDLQTQVNQIQAQISEFPTADDLNAVFGS